MEVDQPKRTSGIPRLNITQHTWQEFYDAGMLWLVNRFLHLFGWSIVMLYDTNDEFLSCYPARNTARGFDEATEAEGFQKVTSWVKNNIEELEKETRE